jgi:ATP-dependent helicase YprA (DUF1998 family)
VAGSGKSLVYQLPAAIRSQREGQVTIVVSPLIALIKDQIEHLQARVGPKYSLSRFLYFFPENYILFSQNQAFFVKHLSDIC